MTRFTNTSTSMQLRSPSFTLRTLRTRPSSTSLLSETSSHDDCFPGREFEPAQEPFSPNRVLKHILAHAEQQGLQMLRETIGDMQRDEAITLAYNKLLEQKRIPPIVPQSLEDCIYLRLSHESTRYAAEHIR